MSSVLCIVVFSDCLTHNYRLQSFSSCRLPHLEWFDVVPHFWIVTARLLQSP